MPKFHVYLHADAGASYEVEAEDADSALQKVYDEVADLSDVEVADWTSAYEVTDADGNVVSSEHL